MWRTAPQARGRVCKGGGPQHRRAGRNACRRAAPLFRRAAARAPRGAGGSPSAHGDTQPPGLPVRRGAGLSHPAAPQQHALGRREPAHQPGHVAGQLARGLALHPGRTEHRPAQPRHGPPHRRVAPPARPGQHGHRRGARRRNHPCGRLHHRHRARGRAAGRKRGLRGRSGRPASRLREPHRALPAGRGTHSRARVATALEPLYHRARRAGQQPARHRRALPAERHDRRDGCERLGQEHPCARHLLPRHEAQPGRGLRAAGRV